jgi:hypothetical protein
MENIGVRVCALKFGIVRCVLGVCMDNIGACGVRIIGRA